MTQAVAQVNLHILLSSEELLVERLMWRGFEKLAFPRGGASNQNKHSRPKLQLIWGLTMYHFDDLPFLVSNLAESSPSSPFGVAASCRLRSGRPLFFTLDEIGGWGTIPTLESLGLSVAKAGTAREGNMLHEGESAALGTAAPVRWLASDHLSPCYICEEVKTYERRIIANDSTYWLVCLYGPIPCFKPSTLILLFDDCEGRRKWQRIHQKSWCGCARLGDFQTDAPLMVVASLAVSLDREGRDGGCEEEEKEHEEEECFKGRKEINNAA